MSSRVDPFHLVAAAEPVPSDERITHSPGWQAWVRNTAALTLILLSAALVYRHFWNDASALWYSTAHDRNGHYRRCQKVAFAIRQGNLGDLVKEIHAATVWPPGHPLVTGPVLAVLGIDYRLAVLSSLLAWAATCWFAFALARRLVPRYKDLAGGVALLLTLASPAHRAFAVDIMIESLGAALTLGTLYFYVAARQEGSRWHCRCFALLWLALFLTKYNYWVLLSAGLLLSALWEFRAVLACAVRAHWAPRAAPPWLLAQLRQPLTYMLIPAFALALQVQFVGPVDLTLGGKHIMISTINFPAHLCWILLMLRILPWWWRSGRHVVARLPPLPREAIRWQGYPLAVWFLWPSRLGMFLWSVTYTQHGRAGDYSPWTGSFHYYWGALTQEYHANLVSLVLVLALVALAFLAWRRRQTGSGAVLTFLAVAALLTNYHSANRSRFLHSWMAVGWVAAGVGAALLFERLGLLWLRVKSAFSTPAPVGGAGPAWRRRLGVALPCGALAALACLQGAALVGPGQAEEGGPSRTLPSVLPIADLLRPHLAQAHHPVLASNSDFERVFDWRTGEEQGPKPRLPVVPRDALSCESREGLEAWLQQNSCDEILLIDCSGAFQYLCSAPFDLAAMRTLLASSGTFVLTHDWDFPVAGHIRAQVWRRTEPRRLPDSLGPLY
jgi:hypothetical protein